MLICKIIFQNIISCCCALLSLQPILHVDVIKLDQHIMQRVHEILGFLFCLFSHISIMLLDLEEFDFSLIACINAGIAVDRIAQDFNHHISAYCLMAHITMADWTCQVNHCCYLLDGNGLECSTCYMRQIPSAWIIAQDHLAKLKLSLQITDQNHLLTGDCSILHVITLTKNHLPAPNLPNSHTLCSIHVMGFLQLKDIGTWSVDNANYTFFQMAQLPHSRWSDAQKKNWEVLHEAFEHICIGTLYNSQSDLILMCQCRRI